MLFKPAFLTYLLRLDDFINPLLSWPSTRFRILNITLTVGKGYHVSVLQGLLADTVREWA
jgi:hypothetical protein